MKIISLWRRGALLAAGACLALACNNVKGSHNQPSQAAASPAANQAANVPPPETAPTQNPEDKMPRIKPDEAKKLVEEGKAIIIDVRGSEAYKQAHIKGALDIHLSDLEAGKFDNLPKNKRIIAYCT